MEGEVAGQSVVWWSGWLVCPRVFWEVLLGFGGECRAGVGLGEGHGLALAVAHLPRCPCG